MLRFIFRETDTLDAANAGGPVKTKFHTLDLMNSGIEDYLREKLGEWVSREFIGVEIRNDPNESPDP